VPVAVAEPATGTAASSTAATTARRVADRRAGGLALPSLWGRGERDIGTSECGH
jgi:hypothetical protein